MCEVNGLLMQFLVFFLKMQWRFIRFEAIKVSVAPVIGASVVAVERQPEITFSGSQGNGEYATPAAKTAVGIAELCFFHAVFTVNTVVGTFLEGIPAREVKLTVYTQEGAACFQSVLHDASADIAEIAEGVVRFKEAINIFFVI